MYSDKLVPTATLEKLTVLQTRPQPKYLWHAVPLAVPLCFFEIQQP